MGYGIDLLENVRGLEQELTREGLDRPLEHIHFRFADNDFRYWITPPDLHVFADTGCDGIHYGFLTDFGRITDLTEAPIVCVSPTDDPPLRIIARSLEDFFRLVVTIGSAGELGNLVSVRTPRQWERYWADLARDRHDEETDPKHRTFFQHRRTVLHRLRTALGLEPIPDVMRYLSDLESERQAAGCIPTIDGLGVVPIEGKEKTRGPRSTTCFPLPAAAGITHRWTTFAPIWPPLRLHTDARLYAMPSSGGWWTKRPNCGRFSKTCTYSAEPAQRPRSQPAGRTQAAHPTAFSTAPHISPNQGLTP